MPFDSLHPRDDAVRGGPPHHRKADIPRLIQRLPDVLRLLPDDPVEFIRETRVLPMETKEGFRVDLIFGTLLFEESAIRRARLMSVAGERVRICTPEDLIVLKIVSDRARDREDVAGIIRTQGAGLDRRYLGPLIEGLLDFYRRCLGGGGVKRARGELESQTEECNRSLSQAEQAENKEWTAIAAESARRLWNE